MQISKTHWLYAILTFAVTFLAGLVAVPFARTFPSALHEFATRLESQRVLILFSVCLAFALLAIKVFKPRLRHLQYFRTHPPTWASFLLGLIVLAILDSEQNLSRGTVAVSWRQWLRYGIPAAVVACAIRAIVERNSITRVPTTKARWIAFVVTFFIALGIGFFYYSEIRFWTPGAPRAQLALLCMLSAVSVLVYFWPAKGLLGELARHPPLWIAIAFGLMVLPIANACLLWAIDGLTVGSWEAVAFGVILITMICVAWRLWIAIRNGESDRAGDAPTMPRPVHDLDEADWQAIEHWLAVDQLPDFDLVEHFLVARRSATRLQDGTRSIGIIGAHGTGKTCIVDWMEQLATRADGDNEVRVLISKLNCWGFDNSALAINEMLASAIGRLELEVDCMHIRALPDTYRRTFVGNNDWLDSLFQIVAPTPNLDIQLSRLNSLLADIGARFVFVIEDLDRNKSEAFDVQDVLALLQMLMLRKYGNISVVITGALDAKQEIDYVKLCQSIEYVSQLDARPTADFVLRFATHCLESEEFSRLAISEAQRKSDFLTRLEYGIPSTLARGASLAEAIAALVKSPRILRLALGRTLETWKQLCGEINFEHLLLLNSLRFGAPKVFQFLLRNWTLLHELPVRNEGEGWSNADRARQAAVRTELQNICKDAEYDPTAASEILSEILPPCEFWLEDGRPIEGHEGIQGLHELLYWRRALAEVLNEGGVGDQKVMQDVVNWLEPASAELLTLPHELTHSQAYCDTFDRLAVPHFYGNWGRAKLLLSQVITRVLEADGSAASDNSVGCASAMKLCRKVSVKDQENEHWLADMIDQALPVSIQLAYDLWEFQDDLIPADADAHRAFFIEKLRAQLESSDPAEALFSCKNDFLLYQLLFVRPNNLPQPSRKELIQLWNTWLPDFLFAALGRGEKRIAVQVAGLLTQANSGRKGQPYAVNTGVLDELFGNRAGQLIKFLRELADEIEGEEQQRLVKEIVESAEAAYRH